MSSAKKRDAIARELEVPLGPEYVSFKNGHAYIEGHKVVALANSIFGFDGWSSEIRGMDVDYVEEKNGRYTLGVSCTMRITLASGTHREDVGYGSSVNMPNRFQAYDKARKEAATDALKRSLRLFGESLGNCLYNKDYVEVVRRLRSEKSTFDVEDMRRPVKRVKSEAVVLQHTTTVPAALKSVGEQGRDSKKEGGLMTRAQLPVAPSDHSKSGHPGEMPMFDSEDDRDDVQNRDGDITPADAVFVTADLAPLVSAPENISTPIPASAIFDPTKPNEMRTTVRQDCSMPVWKSQKQ